MIYLINTAEAAKYLNSLGIKIKKSTLESYRRARTQDGGRKGPEWCKRCGRAYYTHENLNAWAEYGDDVWKVAA